MIREAVVPLPPGQTENRICIFSFWNDLYAPIAAVARPNWEAYAKKHGYALVFYPGEFHLDPTRPGTYGDKGKFELYYDLRGHCDYAMFLDIDSLFMNSDIPIESKIRQLKGGRFFWTYDDNGPLSGLLIAKTDDTTQRHLRYAYERAARENNVRHGKIEPNGISDQDAMRGIMNVPPFSSTFGQCFDAEAAGHCDAKTYRAGKWIIQFAGMSVDEKLAKMREYAQKAR